MEGNKYNFEKLLCEACIIHENSYLSEDRGRNEPNPQSPSPNSSKISRFLRKEEKEGADTESSPKAGTEWSEFLRR